MRYLQGSEDGIVKDVQWASNLCDIAESEISTLARKMARNRTLITISWSLQRAEHGEQPWWMAMVLAAMIGDIGKTGGGINYGMGCVHNAGFDGRQPVNFSIGSLPQGTNAVATYIPVGRVVDMLLNPGKKIAYNGEKITYPNIKAIVWAGGNPFHHHQDLNNFVKAWAKPDVIIVNEIYWTSTARHADIIFPATSPVERNDFSASSIDSWFTPNHAAVTPFAKAKNDYDIYAALAKKLGFEEEFTEGLSSQQWIEGLYTQTVDNAKTKDVTLPPWDIFWQSEPFSIVEQLPKIEYHIEKFIMDPDKFPMPTTQSGKLEIFCQAIADFGYDDCQGHPMWFDKKECLGTEQAKKFPLHLISNQPKHKLHSQLDHGITSKKAKVKGRELIKIHPSLAEKRDIQQGDIVLVFNDRGRCLAAADISNNIREDVVELPTGAWFDPIYKDNEQSLEVHGNPNTLTADVGTSRLAQGCAAHSCLVDIKLFEDELPNISIFTKPKVKEGC